MKYMLMRDRKGLLTSFIPMFSYFVAINVIAVLLIYYYAPDSYRYPPLVERGSWLWNLLLINLGFLVWRLVQRAYFVGRLHGVYQALLSVPRTVWANAINFAASFRALRLYLGHLRSGRPLGWDKTAHEFPSLDKIKNLAAHNRTSR